MALTDEQKVLQADILTEKTDSSTNPNMTYSTSTAKNKALNPNYFSGNDTKVVNAINATFKQAEKAIATVDNFSSKVNEVLLDVGSTNGLTKLEQLRTDMGQQTLVEGLIDLYENKLPTYATTDSIEYATSEELVNMYNAIDVKASNNTQK
jgi:hypothetical protein